MSFTFGNIKVDSKKHVVNLKTIDEIVLDDNSEAYASYKTPVIILTDQFYNKYQIKAIKNFLEANRITRYKIVMALNCLISKEQIKDDQKSGVIDFFRNNSSAFWEEIPKNAVVVTVGSAIYAYTKSDDIYPDYTQQRIFGVSHFWASPDVKNFNVKNGSCTGNWIFPIESFNDIFFYGFSSPPVDSYKTKLAQFQFKTIVSNMPFYPPRYPKKGIEIVDWNTFKEISEIKENDKYKEMING